MGVVADEVLVSVGADFSKYNQQTEQATTKFTAALDGAAKAAEASIQRLIDAFAREAGASTAAAVEVAAANDAMTAAIARRDAANAASVAEAQKALDTFSTQQDAGAAAVEAAQKRIIEALNASVAAQDAALTAFAARAERAATAFAAQQEREAAAAEAAAKRITAAAQQTRISGELLGRAGGIGSAALPGGALGAGILGPGALGVGGLGNLLGGSSGRAGGSGFFNGNRGAQGGAGGLQNVSYQLQDFIVQVASGQSAIRAFSQQAPQLLSGFGQWGAVLGIAAAGVSVLANVIGIDFTTAADRAKEAQASFDLAIKSTHGSFTQQEADTAKAAAGLSVLEQGYLRLAQDNIRQAIEDNNKLFADAGKAAQDAGKAIQIAIVNAVTNTSDETGAIARSLREQFAPLSDALRPILEKLQNPNLSPDEFAAINEQLVALRDTAKALGIDLDPFIKNINGMGNASAAAAQKTKELDDVQKRVNESQSFWAQILQKLGFSIPEATGHVGNFISTLDEYISRLLQIKAIGGNIGDAGVSAARGTTLAEQQQALSILDGTKAGNDKLTQTTSAQSAATKAYTDAQSGSNSVIAKGRDAILGLLDASKAYGNQLEIDKRKEEGSASAKAATTSASVKQQKAQDTALQKLDDEIKLNQRLIDVYKQGEVARIQAQAAYDAEKNALARGYAVGSDAYKQAVADYQLKAEAKRLGDQQLKDLATGDTLTKSVSTSQEAYNAALASYVVQLGKGTISAETYARLVRQLNDQNNGYAEGVQAIGQAFNSGIQGATSFGDALLKVALQLAQLIAQAALLGQGPLSKGFDSLFGTLGGIFNLAGPILTGTPNINTGPALNAAGSALSLLPRAAGGQVVPGTGYMVGEHGPEPFIPSVPGTIIPNHMLNGSGNQSQDVNLTQYINATGDRQIAAAAATAGKIAVEQALNNASKRVRSDGRRFGKG